jgi:hypothetical protein
VKLALKFAWREGEDEPGTDTDILTVDPAR